MSTDFWSAVLTLNLQLKMIAAEAPITPKKPAYTGHFSGLASHIFLASLEEKENELNC